LNLLVILLFVDPQVQFLSIIGTVGGKQADPANKAFSSGFETFNFDVLPKDKSVFASSRRTEGIEDPYACDPFARDSVIAAFVERLLICLGAIFVVSCVRFLLRRLQTWWYARERERVCVCVCV